MRVDTRKRAGMEEFVYRNGNVVGSRGTFSEGDWRIVLVVFFVLVKIDGVSFGLSFEGTEMIVIIFI